MLGADAMDALIAEGPPDGAAENRTAGQAGLAYALQVERDVMAGVLLDIGHGGFGHGGGPGDNMVCSALENTPPRPTAITCQVACDGRSPCWLLKGRPVGCCTVGGMVAPLFVLMASPGAGRFQTD